VVLDAFEELDGELFAHAGELEEVAGLGGGLEGVHVSDLEGGPEEGDGLGAHAGEAEEIEHGGAIFCQEFRAEGHGTGRDEVADVGGHAFADAGDAEQGFGVGGLTGWWRDESGEGGGVLFDGFGSAAVGADTEGVLAVDLKESGGFVEQASNGDVVHGGLCGRDSGRGDRGRMQRRAVRAVAEKRRYRAGVLLDTGAGCYWIGGGARLWGVENVLQSFFGTRDLVCLGTLGTLDHVELDFIAFFETLIAVELDGAVMHEDIWAALTSEEAETLRVVEPLHCAFVLRHMHLRLLRALDRLTPIRW